jgi:predicted P-loop ATPase
VDIKRQCVFLGTTNSDTWLKDETGGRRFWPVRCGHIDLNGLKRDRDQLWAEALQAYHSGDPWWLQEPELLKQAMEEQSGRYDEDVWYDKVLQRAEAAEEGSVTVSEILSRLGLELAKQDQTAANRVARCLKRGGWERYRKRIGDTLQWRYRRRRDQK